LPILKEGVFKKEYVIPEVYVPEGLAKFEE